MNYYYEDYSQRSNTLERELISLADEIVTLYTLGGAKGAEQSLKRTVNYMELFIEVLTGTRVGISDDKWYNAVIKSKMEEINSENTKTIMNEFYLTVKRIGFMLEGERIHDFGYEHNARFVDWTLRLIGLTKKTAFHEANKKALASRERFYTLADEEKYQGQKRMFYRNAYFAERYSHKTYTDAEPDGVYDMYTPLILSRMAVEQYLKYIYGKNIGGNYPDTSAAARKILEEKGIITPVFCNELHTVMSRGNDNTHYGFANYAFTVIHANAVVKRCFMELQTT